MAWIQPKTTEDKVFVGSVLLKGLDGLLEFFGGLLLFFVKPEQIQGFVQLITQRELLHDPNDLVANYLVHAVKDIGGTTVTFLIVYLWVHAAIKLIAVIGLLKNWLWAYPFSLITLGILVLYQIYSIIIHHSIGMILLTIFDVFVLWLIWQEYQKKTATHQD